MHQPLAEFPKTYSPFTRVCAICAAIAFSALSLWFLRPWFLEGFCTRQLDTITSQASNPVAYLERHGATPSEDQLFWSHLRRSVRIKRFSFLLICASIAAILFSVSARPKQERIMPETIIGNAITVRYYLWLNEATAGPFEPQEILDRLQKGEIRQQALCVVEGEQEWKTVRDQFPPPSPTATLLKFCKALSTSVIVLSVCCALAAGAVWLGYFSRNDKLLPRLCGAAIALTAPVFLFVGLSLAFSFVRAFFHDLHYTRVCAALDWIAKASLAVGTLLLGAAMIFLLLFLLKSCHLI